MIHRPAPPEAPPFDKSSRLARYIIGGAVALALVAICIGVGWLILQEQRKYDVVYQRLNIERLPKGLENMPYVQAELVKLVADPCERQSIEALASGLETLGQNAWAKVVRTGYVQNCVSNAVAPTGAQQTLQGLAVDSADIDIRRLAVQVIQRTCDRPAVNDLIKALKKTSNNVPATVVGSAFLESCGQDIPIAYSIMQSYYNIGDYAHSLKLVDIYQRIEPNDPYWPAWRGRNLEKLGRTGEAADAYLRSLSQWAQPSNVALSEFWLAANALRVVDRNCEAVKVLEQYVSYDPGKRRTPQIMTAIAENRALAGGCPSSRD